jgi:tetratricopeptide (TPR) repeat protein
MGKVTMSARVRRLVSLLILGLAMAGLSAQSPTTEAQKLYAQGRYEESRKLALEALLADAGDIDAYVLLCQDFLALGRWADAQNYALKAYALRRDPRLSEILGEAAFNQGANEVALRWFQDYVTNVPEGSSVGAAFSFMGEIFLRQARYAHADIAFSTALQFSPANARWWARLGWAREKGNDRSGALNAYVTALRLEPRLEDAILGKERIESSN